MIVDLLFSFVVNWPFTRTKDPAGNDPQWKHDHDEYGAWTDRHQCLEHKACIEVDAIKSSNASWRRVREQTAV